MNNVLPFDVPTNRVTKGYSAFRNSALEFVDPYTAVARQGPAARRNVLIVMIGGLALDPIVCAGFWLVWWQMSQQGRQTGLTPQLLWLITGWCALGELCFIVMGWLALKGEFGQKPIVIDRKSGWVYEQKPGHDEPVGEPISLKDVAAVQLCSGRFWPKVFEVNLVLSNPPGRRMNLLDWLKAERALSDAQQLAEFLKVPLLDHSATA
jgi:hypothetical protein